MNWPFGNLPRFAYDLIVVDPPWSFENWSDKDLRKTAKGQYSCMTQQDILRLPIGNLAKRDAICLLWATNPMLKQGIEALEAWGFQYKTSAHWVKRTKKKKLGFGTGYILRSAGEPLLVGTMGKPETTNSVRSVFEGLVRQHSRKPEESFAWAERLMPGAKRVEIFSRQSRPGWDAWGNETNRFVRGPK